MNRSPDISQLDAIVLAGGESRRMGVAKASLPFGETSLAGLDVEILEDDLPLQGPLVGLARGLAHSKAPWCFVAACDMPFLQTEVIKSMAARLMDCDAVIPEYEGRLQTLHAFYSSACLPIAQGLLAEGNTSMRALASRCRVTKMSESDFDDIPGGLRSFRDLDIVEEYRDALNQKDNPPI
jgi:molybdopterin-guanine dinucleotide biosynthesis protein A